jgi:hypothetical protein
MSTDTNIHIHIPIIIFKSPPNIMWYFFTYKNIYITWQNISSPLVLQEYQKVVQVHG